MKLLSSNRLKIEKLFTKVCKQFDCPEPTFDGMRFVEVNNVGKVKSYCFKTKFVSHWGKLYNIVLIGHLNKDWCAFALLYMHYTGGSVLLHKYLGKPEEALEIIFNNAKRYL